MDSSVRKIKVDGHDFFGYVVPGALVFAALVVFIVVMWGHTTIVSETLRYLGPVAAGGLKTETVLELKAFHYIGVSIIIILICHVLGHIVATFASLLFDQILIGKIIRAPHERFVALCDLCTVSHEEYASKVEGMRRGRPSLTNEDIKSGFSAIHYRALFSLFFVAPLLYVFDTCPEVGPTVISWFRWLPDNIYLAWAIIRPVFWWVPQVFMWILTLKGALICIAVWFIVKWLTDAAWHQLRAHKTFCNLLSFSQQLKLLSYIVRHPWFAICQFYYFCGSPCRLFCLLFIILFTMICGVFALPMYLIGIVFENLADLRKAFPLVAQLRFKEKYKMLFCVKNSTKDGYTASDFHSEIWWAVYWYVLTTNDVIRERVEKFHTLYRFMRNCGFSCLLCVPLMAGLATFKQSNSGLHSLFTVMAISFWLFACLFVLRYCYIYNNFFAKTVYRAFAFLPDPDPADKANAVCVYCQNGKKDAAEKDDEPEGSSSS